MAVSGPIQAQKLKNRLLKGYFSLDYVCCVSCHLLKYLAQDYDTLITF